MQIEYIPVHKLRSYPNNARTHSKKQIRQIANSIAKFGFCNPVLIDDAKQIIAGHGRVEAAKLLGVDAVPTCRLSHLSEADKRAYILADNRLAERAGWDRELLAIELQGLIDLDFEVELTGFEMPEIDTILEAASEATEEAPRPEDEVPPRLPKNVVTRVGDLWCSASIVSTAVMPVTAPPMKYSSKAPRPNSCSPIRRIMSRSMGTYAGSERSGIVNLRWRPAR